MPRNELMSALVDAQARLITIQAQLLERLRRFGAEGTSRLHAEARELAVEIQRLEDEIRAGSPQRADALVA